MRTIARGMLLLGLLLMAPVAPAGPTEVDGTEIDEQVYRGFDANWRKYARYACEIDGGYAYIPVYDRRLPGSRLMTTSEAERELSVEWEEQNGNLVTKRTRRPPREDAEALSRALPDTKIGSYGWVASAEIVEVLSDKQMIVRELWLVDRDRLRGEYEKDQQEMARRNNGEVNRDELTFRYATRIKQMEQQEDKDEGFTANFRLVGYDTRGLRVGERWKGPNNEGFQVGVVKWETPEPKDAGGDSRRSRRDADQPRLVLSELEQSMRTTLDEEGFKHMLAERGMTVAEFVDLVRTLRDRDRHNAEERIMNALLPEDRLRE